MKYSIHARNVQTGERATFIVEAASEVDAVAQASMRGFAVDQVLLVPQPGDVGYSEPKPASGNGFAIAGLVLGILSMLAWCLPICGFPINLLGIVFSILGKRSQNSGMAKAGLILSIIGIVLTLINGAIGAYLGFTGKHPLFHP